MIAVLLKYGPTGWLDRRESDEGLIRSELFSAERLDQHAETLAEAQEVLSDYEGRKLMPRETRSRSCMMGRSIGCRVVLGAKFEPWRDGVQAMEASVVVGK